MFHYYSNTINIDDKDFQEFLAKKLPEEIQTSPKSISYNKLYEALREAIDEFIKISQGTQRAPAEQSS